VYHCHTGTAARSGSRRQGFRSAQAPWTSKGTADFSGVFSTFLPRPGARRWQDARFGACGEDQRTQSSDPRTSPRQLEAPRPWTGTPGVALTNSPAPVEGGRGRLSGRVRTYNQVADLAELQYSSLAPGPGSMSVPARGGGTGNGRGLGRCEGARRGYPSGFRGLLWTWSSAGPEEHLHPPGAVPGPLRKVEVEQKPAEPRVSTSRRFGGTAQDPAGRYPDPGSGPVWSGSKCPGRAPGRPVPP